ncbi:MAG: hypothetical protein K2K49_04060, partial [Duncaniella sp.]|nr:hypothetical protein [Duncaniella sp.]
QADYPHWIQASGTVSDNVAELTSTSDKLMSYFEPQSKYLVLKVNYVGTGKPVLKVLESRNCDIAPGWRTIRSFEAKDFPINTALPLNPETHFVKLLPVTIGGSLNVTEMRISDATGFVGDDFDVSSLSTIGSDNLVVATLGGVLSVSGVAEGVTVTVYDIAGHTVAVSEGDSTFDLAGGFYIVAVKGHTPVKVKL